MNLLDTMNILQTILLSLIITDIKFILPFYKPW